MPELNITWDTYQGWPFDGAICDNAVPQDDENIIAGMFIQKVPSTDEVKKADGTSTNVFFALEHQSALSMSLSDSMPYIVKNAIMCTTQYTGDLSTFVADADLEIDAANPGKVKIKDTGDKVATCMGTITRHGIDMVKVSF